MKTLFFKKIIVTKYKEVKTGFNLAESFKEGYGSQRAVLPMIINNNKNMQPYEPSA
jgi:hypothetical protein